MEAYVVLPNGSVLLRHFHWVSTTYVFWMIKKKQLSLYQAYHRQCKTLNTKKENWKQQTNETFLHFLRYCVVTFAFMN